MIYIRRAAAADGEAIWLIFQAVVAGGDTYVYAPDTGEAQARALDAGGRLDLCGAGAGEGRRDFSCAAQSARPWVARLQRRIHGQAEPVRARRARAMGLYALAEAKAAKYTAMQFNFVVSCNTWAVALWESLGFSIIGTIPKAFQHQEMGLVDAHIMHRFLD